MVKCCVFLFVVFVSFNVFARSLVCSAYVNLEFKFSNQVDSNLNEKISIGREPNFRAYVTQKENDIFIVEAFIVNQEVRVYGEGTLKSDTDRIKASIWSREEIIDIDCVLAH